MMRLKAVVLPAPFGPISASVSPSRTVKLTSCTACRPLNRLLRFLMTSASTMASPLRRSGAATGINLVDVAHDTGWAPQDHRHQDQAIDGELDATDRIAQPALQQSRSRLQQHCADHRPP